MKNDLTIYPQLREFLGREDKNLDESMLSIYVQSLKESHIELGICVSENCLNEDATEIVQKAMNLMAEMYDSLKRILREQESME